MLTAAHSYIKQLEDKVAQLEEQLQSHSLLACNSAALADSSLNAGAVQEPAGSAPWAEPQRSTSLATECIVSLATASDPVDESADALLGGPPLETRLPTGDAARTLIDVYFEHSDFFTPILSRTKLLTLLEDAAQEGSLYNANEPAPNSLFVASVVFGTSILLLNRQSVSFPSSRADAYFAYARSIIANNPVLIQRTSVQSLENVALMVQFLLLNAKLRPAWHLLGIATRLAIELDLHRHQAHDLSSDAGNDNCWLFWSIYSFERILNAVLERPLGIPDEAITAPLPELPRDMFDKRRIALHLIGQRQLLSEIFTTLVQGPPRNGATLDLAAWREDMLRRVQDSCSIEQSEDFEDQTLAVEVPLGYSRSLLILLLYPPQGPAVQDKSQIALLANTACALIDRYKHLFKAGRLRYYWRTTHHLFRAGSALVYCIKQLALESHNSIALDSLKACVSAGYAVLWGMTERYQPGAVYRDEYEKLLASLDDTAISEDRSALSATPVDVSMFLDFRSFEDYADASEFGVFE